MSGADDASASVDEAIERVAELLSTSKNVLFITGAGISADSGLPTYRGVGGLYEGSLGAGDLPIEEELSGEMFRRDPARVWTHIHRIARAVGDARPNRAHEVIAELERRIPRVWVLTQNVDAFHTRAGSKNVIEIHGDVHRLRCTFCEYRTHVDDWSKLAVPPECPLCGSVLRPEVVFFGELLPEREVEKMQRELERGFDAVVSVGTSSLFPYVAEPLLVAGAHGVPTVEINPSRTDISDLVAHRVTARAAPALDAIYGSFLRRTAS